MNGATPPPGTARLAPAWQALPQRTRRLVVLLLVLSALGLLAWALLPAWRTVQEAPARHRQLETQAARMRMLATQAQRLRALPRSTPDEARQALESATREQLGAAARVSLPAPGAGSGQGEQATVTLTQVPAQALGLWLSQVRTQARVLPVAARLQRDAQNRWSGTIDLGWPAP